MDCLTAISMDKHFRTVDLIWTEVWMDEDCRMVKLSRSELLMGHRMVH